MNKFLFIRHGKTKGNIEKRYIGRTDEPLCEPVILGCQLSIVNCQLFVSPMLRCKQTAEGLFPGKRQTVVEDLRECDFGAFEGRTAEELSTDADYAEWVGGCCEGDIPGGENVDAFKERCCRAFLDIAAMDGELAVLVIHGGVIMAVLERFGRPRRDFYEYHLPNGGYFLRRYENGVLLL